MYTSAVDYTTPGTYQIKFEDIDPNNNITTYYRDMVISDVVPTINFKSENVQTVGNKAPESYDLVELFEATATEVKAEKEKSVSLGSELTDAELIELFEVEVIAADGETKVMVDDSAVDYNTVGQYSITFKAVDTYGVESDPYTSLLDVVEELSLSADETHSVNEDSERLTRTELIDLYNVDYNENNTLGVYQSSIDYNTPGSYEIKFEEIGANGNSKTVISEMVISDVEPTISLTHSNVQALVNDPIDLLDAFGVVATEVETGDITDNVIVDDSAVDYMHIGHYPVYFSVSDNEANSVTAEGDLYLRSDAPSVSANSEETVNEGSSLTNEQLIELFAVTATDSDGIDYIDVDTSRVDFNRPGRYTITFTAYDIYGMNSFEYHSIIEVKDLLPEIVTDNSEITIEAGSSYDLAQLIGIHASEIISDDLNSQVIIDDSQVNYDQAGSYTVTLTVSDDEGNIAQSEVIVTIIEIESDECLNENNGTNGNSNGNSDKNNGTNGNSNGNSDKNNGNGNNKN